MADFILRSGNLAGSIYATLSDLSGPIDLPVSSSVSFVARLLGSTVPTVQAAGVVVAPGAIVGDVNRGVVRYDPVAQDVATQGVYYVTWVVQTPDQPVGYLQSYPAGAQQVMIILPAN